MIWRRSPKPYLCQQKIVSWAPCGLQHDGLGRASCGTCQEALLGRPHWYRLVIPATFHSHLGGGVPEGAVSAPCSKVCPETHEVPTQDKKTIHVDHVSLPRTSQDHNASVRTTSAPSECPVPNTRADNPVLLSTFNAQIILKVFPKTLHLENTIKTYENSSLY